MMINLLFTTPVVDIHDVLIGESNAEIMLRYTGLLRKMLIHQNIWNFLNRNIFQNFAQRVKSFLRPAYANQYKWNLSREHK